MEDNICYKIYNKIQETFENFYNLIMNYNRNLAPAYVSSSEGFYNGKFKEPEEKPERIFQFADSRQVARDKKREKREKENKKNKGNCILTIKCSKKGASKMIIEKSGRKHIKKKRNGSR